MPRQTLLLVDSDARSMRMLEVSLRKAGYEVAMARDGAEAMAAVAARTPDLILSDTRLPPPAGDGVAPRDGYEFCERLQRDAATKGIPFVFLTGSAELEDKIRGLKLGVEDYLTKPIYLKELLTRVQLVLGRKRRDSLTSRERAQFVGELAGMGLIDLLTTVDLGRKTGRIAIEGPEGNGTLTFREGSVIDAEAGAVRGERAVYRMLRWSEGRFEVRFGAAVVPADAAVTVRANTQGLMLEGLRRADEWNHLESRVGGAGEAVWSLEGSAFARAQDSLDPEARALAARLSRAQSLRALLDAGDDDLRTLVALTALVERGIALRDGATPSTVPAEPPGARETMPGFALGIDEALDAFDVRETAFSSTTGTDAATSHEQQAPTAKAATEPAPQMPTPAPATPPVAPAQRGRPNHQERDVAKHKSKRPKGNREQGASAPPSQIPAATSVPPREAPVAQPVASSGGRAEAAVHDKGLRVEGNVIHLPSSPAPSSADDSGPQPAQKADAPSPADVSTVRGGEGERTTLPPEEKAVALPPPLASLTRTERPPAPDAKADEKPSETAKPDEKKPDEKKPEPAKAAEKKPDEKKSEPPKGAEKKPELTATRKEGATRREHKESLSTHLSDEARAFFSDQAYQAAYKTDHDSFEDLVPAHEEHATDAARSRRWMTIAGGVSLAIIGVVLSFTVLHNRFAVRETALDTTNLASRSTEPPRSPDTQPAPPPAAEPAPAPPAPSAEPAPAPAAAADGDASAAAAPAVEPAPTPAPEPAVAAADASAAAAPTPTPVPAVEPAPTPAPAPTPTPAPAVEPAPAAPTGQTPQQLLAAARAFRGPLAGRIAAYNAYFDAAPQDTRTMTTLAMSLAEQGRNAEAEAVANRAVTAAATNAQAWFILAFTRKNLHNAEGYREARTRCVSLGGQWAAECRAL